MWQAARLGYRILAGLFVAGAVVQFFLAGLGVFGTGAAFGVHATVGTILAFASVVLLVLTGVLALGGGVARRSAGLAALLVVLMVVQYSLVELFSGAVPALAALHPVNGLLVLGAALLLALERRPPPPR
jgi:Family of unknown function (DUF6220)